MMTVQATTWRRHWGCVLFGGMVAVGAATSTWGAPERGAGAKADSSANLVNAALQKYGSRISLEAGPGVVSDKGTSPEASFDGNARTRKVMTGVPYTFTVELLERIPVQTIAFTASDYSTEASPKNVTIMLDDGTVIHHVLEQKFPVKRKPAWQEVAIGKPAKMIRITIESVYPNEYKWGGVGDIAVLTSADLEGKLQIPDYDPGARTFVDMPPVQSGPVPRVTLPQVAPAGTHPRLLISKDELSQFRKELETSERGPGALKTLFGIADGLLKMELNFPDPKGTPAQLKDRGDPVARQHSELSKAAGTLGIAYALTDNKAYAKKAAEILRGYSERYEAYPEHQGANRNDTSKVMAQRLSEAMWLIPLIEGFDYIHDSGVLSDQDKQNIEQQLIRPCLKMIWRATPAEMVAKRNTQNKDWRTAMPKKTGRHVGNWLNFYNAATMMAGAVLGDQDMIDLATANFREMLVTGIGSDGMWNEGSISYQNFAISAMVPGLETAARHGIDLWSFDHDRIKMLFDSPLRYAYPDGSAPGIGDSGRARSGNWSTMIYDYAHQRFGDPGYAFLVNNSPRQLQMSEGIYFPTRVYEKLPEPTAAHYPSTIFDSLGFAIMRNSNIYSLMTYGPHAGVHGHFDKLNLILFFQGENGKGDEMGGEPVMHRYEDSLHGQWTVQTVAHNAMTVDERSQMPAKGQLLVFSATDEMQVMRAQCATAYPGVLLDRTVVVMPEVVLDLYRGRSALPHTWDRTLRFNGVLDQLGADKLGADAKPLGNTDGYQHLLVSTPLSADQSWRGTWQTDVGSFQATLAGVPNQQVILAQGPDKDQIALARQTGTQAQFAAAYQMRNWANPVQSLTLESPENSHVTVARVQQNDGTVTTVFVADAPGQWKAAGWQSDARVLCVRQKDGQTLVSLNGGTFARSDARGDGGEVRRPVAGNYSAQGKDGALKITAQWTPAPTEDTNGAKGTK